MLRQHIENSATLLGLLLLATALKPGLSERPADAAAGDVHMAVRTGGAAVAQPLIKKNISLHAEGLNYGVSEKALASQHQKLHKIWSGVERTLDRKADNALEHSEAAGLKTKELGNEYLHLKSSTGKYRNKLALDHDVHLGQVKDIMDLASAEHIRHQMFPRQHGPHDVHDDGIEQADIDGTPLGGAADMPVGSFQEALSDSGNNLGNSSGMPGESGRQMGTPADFM